MKGREESRATDPLFTFVQLSDAHVGNENSRPTHRRLQAAVALANALCPAFVIDTGDVATHPVYAARPEHLAEFEEYRRYVAALEVPLHVVPGNHDIGYADPGDSRWGDNNPWGDHGKLVKAYEKTFGPLNRAFSQNGFRFVLANNNPAVSGGSGVLTPGQLKWIEDELRRGEVTFVFCHIELLEQGEGPVWGESAQALAALCEGYGVPAVAYGHKHRLHVTEFAGTQYIMCPDLKVPCHEHVLQYRVWDDGFELWLYNVFLGEAKRLGWYAYPQRKVRPSEEHHHSQEKTA